MMSMTEKRSQHSLPLRTRARSQRIPVNLAPYRSARYPRLLTALTRHAPLITILLSFLGISAAFSAEHEIISGKPGVHSAQAVVSLQGMGMFERLYHRDSTNHSHHPADLADEHEQSMLLHAHGADAKSKKAAPYIGSPSPAQAAPLAAAAAPPMLAANFQAFTNAFDPSGAVGPNHLMAAYDTSVVIQDRKGKILSSVTLNSFWA